MSNGDFMGTEQDIQELKASFKTAQAWRKETDEKLHCMSEVLGRVELAIGGDPKLGIKGLLDAITKFGKDLEDTNKILRDAIIASKQENNERFEAIEKRIDKLEKNFLRYVSYVVGGYIVIEVLVNIAPKAIEIFKAVK